MYRESQSLDDIKRVINFPKLEMPPGDFLQNMEDYAKQAPRQFDNSGPKKVRARHCWVPASPVEFASAPTLSNVTIVATFTLLRRRAHL